MTELSFTFEDPRLQRFYEYWRSKCRPGVLPGRQDIDPVDIPELLPWIMLVDAVPVSGGHRFRMRLVGTGIVGRTGRDATGKWYEELFAPRDVERFSAIYAEIIKTGLPHHFHSNYDIQQMEGREHVRYERVLCPLATDGTTIDVLAGIVVFLDGPGQPRL